MMEEKDYKEVKEIFNRFFNKSIINLEDAGKLAKIIIKKPDEILSLIGIE